MNTTNIQIKKLQKTWNRLAEDDPYWAVLSWPEMKRNKWTKKNFFLTGQTEVDDLMNYIKSLNLPLQKRQALDFGCGIGRVTLPLSDYYSHVHGVDISKSMIHEANKENSKPEKVTYHLNESTDLSFFKDQQMNLIYSNITLQHMKPILAKMYIAEFIRILNPKGILIFQIPSHIKKLHRESSYKNRIIARLPIFLSDGYMAFKEKCTGRVYFEMNGITKAEIVALVEAEGAYVLDIIENQEAGPKMVSYRYTVVKQKLLSEIK